MPIHCHQNCNQMCLNMGYVVDGVVVRQKTDDSHADSFDCPQQRGCLRGRSLRQQVYNADRIKYPMKRKSWQPGGGENAHGELRGKDEWERISWDEALTLRDRRAEARLRASTARTPSSATRWRWAPGSAMFPGHRRRSVQHRVRVRSAAGPSKREALGMYSHGDHPDLMMAPRQVRSAQRRHHRAVRLQSGLVAALLHVLAARTRRRPGSSSCSSAPTTTPPPPPWTPAGSACAPAPTRPSS